MIKKRRRILGMQAPVSAACKCGNQIGWINGFAPGESATAVDIVRNAVEQFGWKWIDDGGELGSAICPKCLAKGKEMK